MIRFSKAGLCLLLLASATACTNESNDAPVRPRVKGENIEQPTASPEAPVEGNGSPSPDPSPSTSKPPQDYSPDAELADRPRPLAAQLSLVHDELAKEIAGWLKDGGEPGVASRSIALKALFQQRIYRTMVQSPRLGRKTLEFVSKPFATTARENFDAGYRLSSGLSPVKPPVTFKTYAPASPHLLLSLHKRAGRRYGIPWQILAAVNLVETRFGRILGPSSAGALGPMQFLPSTWTQYGNGGDIMDPHDSIFAASRYLAASNGRTNISAALYQYNPSDDYVNAVRLYARSMKRDERNFYSFYHWQVFVRTTKGDKQLTGPGSNYNR